MLRVSVYPSRLAALAVLLAAVLGAAVGGMSHLSAVPMADPRPTGLELPTRASTTLPSPSPTLEPTAPPSATAVATVAPTATPEADVWLYEVEPGDSISGIAIRFGTTTERLLSLNPEYAANENLIRTGAQVIVPCTPIALAEERC